MRSFNCSDRTRYPSRKVSPPPGFRQGRDTYPRRNPGQGPAQDGKDRSAERHEEQKALTLAETATSISKSPKQTASPRGRRLPSRVLTFAIAFKVVNAVTGRDDILH